jgi:hypothetical protein
MKIILQDCNRVGPKIVGVNLLKNFRGEEGQKISKKISQICDNHRGYQNQLQNLG